MPLRLLTTLLLLTFPALAAEYSFTLNGDPFHPTILPVKGERKGAPALGDISRVGDIPFVLQKPGYYKFRTEGEPVTKLFCKLNDAPEHCVGTATRTSADGKSVNNPLRLMTSADKAKLWGVAFYTEPESWLRDLHGIDGTSTVIHFDLHPKAGAKSVRLPALPENLRYLSIETPPDCIIKNPEVVSPLHDLLYLDLNLNKHNPHTKFFESGQNYSVVNLSIRGGGGRALPRCPRVRFLKLREMPQLKYLKSFRWYPDLRVVKIDGSGVENFFVLGGLKNLRLLSANNTPLTNLPLQLYPNLRDLRIANTPVLQNRELVAKYRSVASVSVKNWEPSIRAFEKWDAENEVPEKPILFTGSSSVRLWKLKKSFPDHVTLNRGFGGSELSDALIYFDRIVLPYRPRAILLYAGDNDVGRDESAEQVIADFNSFAAKVRAKLPKTHFAYLPIKPSLQRWELWPEMQKANEAIRKITETDKNLHYLDTVTPMLGDDGKPRPEFFLNDGLHMNAEGYKAWTAVVTPWLNSLK